MAHVKQQACALAAESLSDNLDDEGSSANAIASNTLSAAFMSWLVNSEKAQKVLDLIKIDCEKQALQAAHHGRQNSSGSNSTATSANPGSPAT